MFRQALTISGNTFTEAIRQPVFTVLVLIGALGLVLNVFLAAYSMEPGRGDNKILIDLGLSTVLLVGLLLAAFTATGVVAEEIEAKTVLTVVSKPVPRPLFVLAKFLGVTAAIGVAHATLSCIFTLSLRHRVMQNASDHLDGPVLTLGVGGALLALLLAAAGNYLYRRSFTSTFVALLCLTQVLAVLGVSVLTPQWGLQPPLAELTRDGGQVGQVLLGLFLLFEAVVVLTALCVALSTRLGQLPTLLIALGVFFAGLIAGALSGWVDQRLSLPPGVGVFESLIAVWNADIGIGLKPVYTLAKLVYLALPNLQFFWPADAISQGNSMIEDLSGRFTLAPILSVSGYALLYTVALLGAAVALFQRREVG
ncbi:membrane protein [Phycisphaera mikurensis]|uniref:Hypothetical membrane protein n=1 Tax=Phycisphaera mikurensis (strain NBRC 102666 / KCTC 22515 / FYK2301M01) TaxID=1142394 RepID=I0IEM7_PHYMF|nr:membrane protein [Phycisphaera mikurensis]MBB6441513.1 ABC-type transport system involved in multi-copper enzyme maturation permease subunit [Phycisphaera mikurensis]BAM03715.1 hypothetical membrane protein [Phycisphaera mikurensis NBRC 102666]